MDSVSSSSFISTFSPKPYLLLHRSSSPLLLRINSAAVEERSPASDNNGRRKTTPLSSATNPKLSLATALFTTVEHVINNFIDPPSRPSVDPKHVLSDNFAPVLDELPPTDCEIIHGVLPPSLDGAYIRNGPNPQFLPRGP